MKYLVALVVLVLVACSSAGTPVANPTPMTRDASISTDAPLPDDTPYVVKRSPTEWTVRVTHALAGRRATGEIATTTMPTPAALAPHFEVASAGAWLDLARASFDANDDANTIAAARSGIDALGSDYRPRDAKDDTGLTLLAAEDDIKQGNAHVGAHQLVKVLDHRIDLYYTKFKDSVRKP